MAVTLSEQEKQALGDIFISIGQKKSFFHKITFAIKKVLAYISQLKREYKGVKK